MFKKNLAMMIYSLFIPQRAHEIPVVETGGHKPIEFHKGGKGQLRAAKPQSSGAAQLKRASKKRKNKQQ